MRYRTALTATALLLAASPALASTASAASGARVTRWIDGDTVLTTAGEVRLIGVDTPERGRCGAATATALSKRLAPVGSRIRLVDPVSVRDRDRYGRLLRYVDRGATDVGERQIRNGAWARYDSRDGYQSHPRQALYRRLDGRFRNYCGAPHPGTGVIAPAPSSAGGVSGAVSPIGRSCPSYAPIKGNASSMIYHSPGQQHYSVTVPEACFRNAASAQAAGYRAAKV